MRKHIILTLAILAVTASVTVYLEIKPSVAKKNFSFARRIPLTLGVWRGEEMKVSQAVINTLLTDDLLMRSYTNHKRQTVIFAAVFATDNRRAAHPPEICYRGQGWSVEGKTSRCFPVNLPAGGYVPPSEENGEAGPQKLGHVTLLEEPVDFAFTELIIRHKSGQRQVVHYWYKTGGRSTNNLLLHEWHMLVNNAFHRGSTNSLLRVSCEARSESQGDIMAARLVVQDFCKAVFPYTIASMP